MNVMDRIRSEVESHPIVLYMKGTREHPMCGYSSRAVEALAQCHAKYLAVNVMADPEVRANLPRFSGWPTFPQLFINGELIGGSVIALELHASGELKRMAAEAQHG